VKTKNAEVIYVRNQMEFLNGQNEWYKIQMDYAIFLQHYRKWNKRSNKNWVMQILLRWQLPRKSVHISTSWGKNFRSIQVICHGY